MSRLTPLADKATTPVAIAAIRPVGAVGTDITTWSNAGYSMPFAIMQVRGDQAIVLSSPTGGSAGPELWGMVNGRWGLLSYLNRGQSISIPGSALDYVEEVQHVGICTRLLVAATKDGGSPTVVFMPIESL